MLPKRNMLPKRRMSNFAKGLIEARHLSGIITRKMKSAGFTHEEIEKDVHEVFREIKRNRRSNRG
ncbi:hypothetical protein [Desulfofundulus thermocisternus]|uniref:hypothetical protein n=1 Tax=Desulfofundulus thermocisternus TaxID=42471 RepID=UPI00217E3623|nr:hypothetical protein [Desulfofundulus thermocisternus]